MDLSAGTLAGIVAFGWENPLRVHQHVIVPFKQGRDIIASVPSSLTAAISSYSIGILERLDYGKQKCQALILLPNRELAIGTAHLFSQLGTYRNVVCQTVIGGTDIRTSITAIQKGVHVIVGTPGRTCDLIERKILDLQDIRMLVLESPDKTLDMEFRHEMDMIISALPPDVQVAMFSSSITSEVVELAARITKNPFMYSEERKVNNTRTTIVGRG